MQGRWKFNNFNERKVVMSRVKKEKKTAVGNMIAVMFADGKVTPEEAQLLAGVCMKLGITPEEKQAILEKGAKNITRTFTPAKDNDGLVNQLLPAVMMMMADGDIAPFELKFCESYATALGLPSAIVSEMIELIHEGVNQDQDKDAICEQLLSTYDQFLKRDHSKW